VITAQAVPSPAPARAAEVLRFESADGAHFGPLLEPVVRACRASLDLDALAPRMMGRPPRALDETPYRGVRCTVHWPAFAEPEGEALERAEDAARVLRTELEAAVDRALAGARRVAVFAGGGMDSGGLLAVAAQRARARGATVIGLALDFGGRADDRPYLRALEAKVGCEILRVSPEDARERFGLVLTGVDAMPFVWPSAALEVEAFARARANGADVVLSGLGGDELFDGDPWALSELARSGRIRDALHLARTLRGFPRPPLATLQWPFRRLVASRVPRPIRLLRARRAPLATPAWAGPRLARWYREQRDRETERTLDPASTGPSSLDFHRVQLLSLRHLVVTTAGIPRRDPYMDPRFRAVAARIPKHLWLHGGVWRGLFRLAFGDLLPIALRERMDKADVEPALGRYLEAIGGFERIRPLATVTRLGEAGLVEPRAFARAFDAFTKNREDGDAWTTLWPALATEAFLRTSRA
jgi:asparagine synthetase B (glutamine-hydrolysing)